MAARPIGSVILALGLVTIPVKLYTAQSKREIAFNRLDKATGARVKQQLVSGADGRVLESDDIVSGYEYTPDKFVTFTGEELKALEAEAGHDRIAVVAVASAASLELVHLAKSTILGPDKGAARAYHLLAIQLATRGEVAIAQRGGKTRDELLVLEPVMMDDGRVGLVAHEALYENETRHATMLDPDVVPAGTDLTRRELELAGQLLDGLRREGFREAIVPLVDTGAQRVEAAVAKKVAGQEIVVPPPREDSSPVDLLAQLVASIPARAPKKARAAAPPVSQAQSRRRRAG